MPIRKPTETEVNDYLLSHSIAEGDCIVWTGPVKRSSMAHVDLVWPVMGLQGMSGVHARRAAYAYVHPDVDLTGKRVRLNPDGDCHPMCVNPDHMLVDSKY